MRQWAKGDLLTDEVGNVGKFVDADMVNNTFQVEIVQSKSLAIGEVFTHPLDFLLMLKPYQAETIQAVAVCDCGGMKTYQSDAPHYHSRWCQINQGKVA